MGRLPTRTHYTVLKHYLVQYGGLTHNPDQVRYALADLNEIMDFARHQLDILLDADAAKRISNVGLAWLAYAATHPQDPTGFAERAQQKLEG